MMAVYRLTLSRAPLCGTFPKEIVVSAPIENPMRCSTFMEKIRIFMLLGNPKKLSENMGKLLSLLAKKYQEFDGFEVRDIVRDAPYKCLIVKNTADLSVALELYSYGKRGEIGICMEFSAGGNCTTYDYLPKKQTLSELIKKLDAFLNYPRTIEMMRETASMLQL